MSAWFFGLMHKASAAPADRRPLILAGLAFVSALLTNYAPEDPWKILQIALDKDVPTPILPGIYFGLVLAAAVYLWTSKSVFNAVAVLAITVVAWVIAHYTAVRIFHYHETWAQQTGAGIARHFTDVIDQYRALLSSAAPQVALLEFTDAAPSIKYPYAFAVAGVLAGLLGSAITAFGVSVVSAEFRTPDNWMRTIWIGTIAGVLLQWPELKPFSSLSINILYFVWQPAVAASIGYGLTRTGARA